MILRPLYKLSGVWVSSSKWMRVCRVLLSIKDEVEIIRPLEKQVYGDTEFEVKDLNGYVLVFSELIESD